MKEMWQTLENKHVSLSCTQKIPVIVQKTPILVKQHKWSDFHLNYILEWCRCFPKVISQCEFFYVIGAYSLLHSCATQTCKLVCTCSCFLALITEKNSILWPSVKLFITLYLTQCPTPQHTWPCAQNRCFSMSDPGKFPFSLHVNSSGL